MRRPRAFRSLTMIGPALALLAGTACTEDSTLYHPSDALAESHLTDGGTTEGGSKVEAGGGTDGGFLCVPNSFVKCSTSAALLLCNSTGTGTTVVSCAPYTCDSSSKRCTQCDPATTPTCQGNDLVSCSSSGLKVTTSCPGGCTNGVCSGCTKFSFYLDYDKDGYGDPKKKLEACVQPSGYVANALDCDDLDASAHPGQQAFFQHPTSGTLLYDYNCDGAEEKEYGALASCKLVGATCSGDGWVTTVPACGQSGSFGKCAKKQGQPGVCGMTSVPKTQACR